MLRNLFCCFSILLALTLPAARAQTTQPADCGCQQNFQKMQQLIEANYAGYRDKVTPATQPRLDSLTAVVRARADTARASNCGVILYQWLTFFRDGHLALQSQQNPLLDTIATRARFANAERLPWTRASFRAYLDDRARPKQPLEGIWRDADSRYQVGIVAVKSNHYQAFVLKADSVWWMPGQVKFSFPDPAAGPVAGVYRIQNHTEQPRRVSVPADGVLALDNARWYRFYPRPVPVPAAPARHSFEMLDDTTALYRIASFDGNYRPLIDSLTRANATRLKRTKLLILDLRGNGGGSDGSYRSLEPYLYTSPVQTVGVQLWSTAENNRKYSGALFPNMSTGEKIYFARLRRRLDAHQNQLVRQGPSNNPLSISRMRRGKQHPEVARVAVLQNHNCGSTTEQFLLLARQSGKTKLFGENSAGVLDYANMQFTDLPSYQLRLGWATSRSHRLDRGEGIDNVGIAPDVRLDPNDPNVVEQVRAWYRARP